MEKKVTSVESYISNIMKLKREKEKLGLNDHQWYFRGQKDSSWLIVPNAFRGDCLQSEGRIIQNAIRQNPFEFKGLTEFEELTKLQHYGLGTRLLDVTLNPLVALYFATEPATSYREGKNGQFSKIDQDGAVYFNYAPWHSVTELGVKIAMEIPFLEFAEGYSLGDFFDRLKSMKTISDADITFLSSDQCKPLIEYIQKSFFIISTHSNERLTMQSGAFILPTAINVIPNGNGVECSILTKADRDLNSEFDEEFYLIPEQYKESIREELDFFNINEATLFPELEHQMGYIQKRGHNLVGAVPQFKPYLASQSATVEKDYNDAIPNVEEIINQIAPNIPTENKTSLFVRLREITSHVDWKTKEQARSQIRLTLTKQLQSGYSAIQSKIYAQKILDMMLAPTEQYALKEE